MFHTMFYFISQLYSKQNVNQAMSARKETCVLLNAIVYQSQTHSTIEE